MLRKKSGFLLVISYLATLEIVSKFLFSDVMLAESIWYDLRGGAA